MSIVVITIPDPVKQEFVRHLQEKTGAVDLVIIQERPPKLWHRRWYKSLRPTYLYYSLLLRLRPALRTALSWFRAVPDQTTLQKEWSAPAIWTDDINSPKTKTQIATHAPQVLAIWGSGLIDDDTINMAEHTINLHLGLAPYYRGALANQFAVGRGDLEHVGYTIHYVNPRADAGDIIAARAIPAQENPRDTFCTINEKARIHYIDIINKIVTGKTIDQRSQDTETGHLSRMQDWTPQRRYQLAIRLLRWRRSGRPPHSPLPAFAYTSDQKNKRT